MNGTQLSHNTKASGDKLAYSFASDSVCCHSDI